MKSTYDKMPKMIQYFLVEGMTKLTEEQGKHITDIWPEMLASENKTIDEWNINLVVNGVEVPIESFFAKFDESMDEFIVSKAKDLLHDRLKDFESVLFELQESVEAEFEKRFNRTI